MLWACTKGRIEMPYKGRDAAGQITVVSDHLTDTAFDQIPQNDPELRAFLQDAGNDQARERLSQSDLEMVRVIEDLVDLLIGKNVFNFTDLPRVAQKKLLDRRQLRRNLSVLTNLVGDADDIF
jgi:hypothetical protein